MEKSIFRRKGKLLLLAAVVILAAMLIPEGKSFLAGAGKAAGKAVVILDPGHGGFDGGAEDAAGVCEKDINLSIAQKTGKRMKASGMKVLMTRDTDTELGKAAGGGIRSRKTADLIARRERIDCSGADFCISIHLNSFREDPRVHGIQVFYPKGEESDPLIRESKRLAETLYEEMASGLEEEERRPVLEKGDVRLLKNAAIPTVLVECGFLSNAEESKRLQSEEYQARLAEDLCRGAARFLEFK